MAGTLPDSRENGYDLITRLEVLDLGSDRLNHTDKLVALRVGTYQLCLGSDYVGSTYHNMACLGSLVTAVHVKFTVQFS